MFLPKRQLTYNYPQIATGFAGKGLGLQVNLSGSHLAYFFKQMLQRGCEDPLMSQRIRIFKTNKMLITVWRYQFLQFGDPDLVLGHIMFVCS